MTRADKKARFARKRSRDHRTLPEPAALAIIPEDLLPLKTRRKLLAKAKSLHISVDDLILSEHHLDEDTYYRLVAQWLGLTFSPDPLKVMAPSRAREAWQSRIIRLDPAHHIKHWLTAPKGQALEQLLTAKPAGNTGFSDLVITTPSALFRSIADSKTKDYTQHFSTYLHDKSPHFSCHMLCHNGWSRMLPLLALPVGALGLHAAGLAFSHIITCLMLPLLLLRLVLLATEPHRETDAPTLSDKDLPFYSLLVPLYREADVIPQLIASLSALDYPPAKREVLLLIEADDHTTRRALASILLPYGFHVVVLPAGLPRTKPRALNVGLAFASGSLIVVYDAEDRPHKQQLREAASLFAAYGPETACLQSALVIDNGPESPLAHLFALEYACLFDVLIPRQTERGWPVPLGGSSNHFRRACLSQALGWDAWNVTEDADLGLRLYRLGYHIAHLPSLTLEDAPTTLKDWFMQRRRWIKGWIMTSVVHLRHPRVLFEENGLVFTSLLVSQCLGIVGSVLFWPLTLFVLPEALFSPALTLAERMVLLLPLACALPAILIPLIKGARLRKHPLPVWIFPAIPFYFMLMTVAGWVSLFDYLVKPHHWHKTPHKPHG